MIKSMTLFLPLLMQGCAQKVETKSDFVDVKLAEIISVEDKTFLRIRGQSFQSSSHSVKKVLIERKDHRAEVKLLLGLVSPGENNLFEITIPFDDGLKEVWIGSPLKCVWTRSNGLDKGKKYDKLPTIVPSFKGN